MALDYSRFDKIQDVDDTLPEGTVATRFDGGEGSFTPSTAPEHACLISEDEARACRAVRKPPDAPVTPSELMRLCVRAILDPLPGAPEEAAIPQHRPSIVTFTLAEHAAACAPTLSRIGVECSVLSEAPGMAAYVRGLSHIFVERDIAQVGDAADKAGILTGSGVTPSLAAAFFAVSDAFSRAAPWKLLSDRQTLRMTSDMDVTTDASGQHIFTRAAARGNSFRSASGTAWASVIGSTAGSNGLHKGGDPSTGETAAACGICVFFKRYDAEYRILSPMVTQAAEAAGTGVDTSGPPAPPPAEPHPLDYVCAYEACTHGKPFAPASLRRCGGCRDVYYCSGECQRAAWTTHKTACKERALPKPRPTGAYWGAKECVLLLDDVLALPFDDLDLLDKLGYRSAEDRYPIALTFVEGSASRPSATDLIWLMRAMLATLNMTDNAHTRPAALELRPSSEAMDVPMTLPDMAAESPLAKLFAGDAHTLLVRTDPILTPDEAAAIARAAARSSSAPTASSGADAAAP